MNAIATKIFITLQKVPNYCAKGKRSVLSFAQKPDTFEYSASTIVKQAKKKAFDECVKELESFIGAFFNAKYVAKYALPPLDIRTAAKGIELSTQYYSRKIAGCFTNFLKKS